MNRNRHKVMLMGVLGLLLAAGCGADQSEAWNGGARSAEVISGSERDLRLCGNWRRTVSSPIRDLRSSVCVTSDFHLQLAPSGRFSYSGQGAMGYGGRGGSGYAPVGNRPICGMWKTQRGVLWYRMDGGRQWVPAGWYSISGNAVVISTSAGGRQLWERV